MTTLPTIDPYKAAVLEDTDCVVQDIETIDELSGDIELLANERAPFDIQSARRVMRRLVTVAQNCRKAVNAGKDAKDGTL